MGAILYNLVTGKNLIKGATLNDVVKRTINIDFSMKAEKDVVQDGDL